MYILESFSEEETIKFGKVFSKFLKPKDVVILEGQLGGGKTTFVKGILKGFGISKSVISPTFVLIREYTKKFNIYHIDLYRLDKEQMNTIPLDDILYNQNSICLIEWGDKISDFLIEYIRVGFEFLGENSRKIFFQLFPENNQRLKLLVDIFKKAI